MATPPPRPRALAAATIQAGAGYAAAVRAALPTVGSVAAAVVGLPATPATDTAPTRPRAIHPAAAVAASPAVVVAAPAHAPLLPSSSSPRRSAGCWSLRGRDFCAPALHRRGRSGLRRRRTTGSPSHPRAMWSLSPSFTATAWALLRAASCGHSATITGWSSSTFRQMP